jgi:GT2 family glycosyltransferase
LVALIGQVRTFAERGTEIIVTDDSPAGPPKDWISRDYPSVRWMQGPRRGPAANRNHGARHATGQWLLFIDDDCIPQPDLLKAYDTARNAEVQVMEGKIVADGPMPRVDYECPENLTGGYLWSANFAIRRDLFGLLGGFWEEFPYAFGEDVDIRERLKILGRNILFCDAAIVMHGWRPRRGGEFIAKRNYSTWILLKRHGQKLFKTKDIRTLNLLRLVKRRISGAIRIRNAAGLFGVISTDIYEYATREQIFDSGHGGRPVI